MIGACGGPAHARQEDTLRGAGPVMGFTCRSQPIMHSLVVERWQSRRRRFGDRGPRMAASSSRESCLGTAAGQLIGWRGDGSLGLQRVHSVTRNRRRYNICLWDAWLPARSGCGLLTSGTVWHGFLWRAPSSSIGGHPDLVRRRRGVTSGPLSSSSSGAFGGTAMTWSSMVRSLTSELFWLGFERSIVGGG
jgi:hypothetical protein